jgi:hypothetical protein
MIWAIRIEHQIGIVCCSQGLGASISLATGMRVAHLFRAVGGMTTRDGGLVAEITGTSHSLPSLLQSASMTQCVLWRSLGFGFYHIVKLPHDLAPCRFL